ncbi:hypothetical protein DFH08DRAFT_443246 [Mycena albidolilacea]|uniref:Uncharacterized protein n=1 Tax=Mycena albidolilacea TaxID=1033008 RepID=A0AAD7AH62_9AGAR|nr:hypothetical protein DFH08DRAFT_443246 [Mycena albidolilacea]
MSKKTPSEFKNRLSTFSLSLWRSDSPPSIAESNEQPDPAQPLQASPVMPKIAEIEANIDAHTAAEDTPTGPPRIAHQVLMLDEIVVEKRARWDDKTNMILGACREHSQNATLEFCHLDDASTSS